MKITTLIPILTSFFLVLLVNRCTESTQPNVHPVEWMDPSNGNFHGRQLLTEGLEGIEYCRTCHGNDLSGGSAGIACDQCHAGGYSGHPGADAFMSLDSTDHHGRFFYETGADGVEYCKNCHGEDLTGGETGYSCFECHTGGANGHPDASQFLDISDSEFHGNGRIWGVDTFHCMNCHGDDLDGGVAGFSCRDCHTNELPVHSHDPADMDITSPLFHATDYTWSDDTLLCNGCHGDNLDGGVAQFSCRTCHDETMPVHSHDPGYFTYGSPEFHGSQFDWDTDIHICQGCHGDDLNGGFVGFSCRTCHTDELPFHAHGPSLLDPSSPDYHGKLLWDNGWDFSTCERCHGDDLGGGYVNTGCTTSCHQEQNGLGYCANCHGDRLTGNPAPPLSIMNGSDPASLSIGAHQAHLNSTIAVISCDDCHIVPDDYLDPGHLGSDNRAEVEITTDFQPYYETPAYDYNTGTCTNTYCHGSFVFLRSESSNSWGYADDQINGDYQTPEWTDTQDMECSSCHGLPPEGHLYVTVSCSVCHSSVVDNSQHIIDPTKHINGAANTN